MSSPRKRFTNLMFPAFAGAGAWLILRLDTMQISYSVLLPAAGTALYGLLIGLLVSNQADREYAEHQVDSIYFLGFLFTLYSLAVFFYRLNAEALADSDIFSRALYYVGISVTTSIAGVLCRGMVRSAYLRGHPEESVDLEKSYALLKSIADSFSTSYAETFETVRRYFDQRMETTAAVEKKEREYLQALDSFSTAAGRFAAGLKETQVEFREAGLTFSRELARQQEPIQALAEAALSFSHAAGRIRADLEALPLEAVSGDCERFRKEVGDLDTVLDGLVEILERKVERIRL